MLNFSNRYLEPVAQNRALKNARNPRQVYGLNYSNSASKQAQLYDLVF